jgi:hypothetical protein
MIYVEVRDIPKEWWENDNSEVHALVGTCQMASLKDGYVTLSPSGDNLLLEYVRFIQDIDGDMTREEFNNLKKTA